MTKPRSPFPCISCGKPRWLRYDYSSGKCRRCAMLGKRLNVADLTGQTFGRLTVTERSPVHGIEAEWVCSCSCGGTAIVRGSRLRTGKTRSCGCLVQEKAPPPPPKPCKCGCNRIIPWHQGLGHAAYARKQFASKRHYLAWQTERAMLEGLPEGWAW